MSSFVQCLSNISTAFILLVIKTNKQSRTEPKYIIKDFPLHIPVKMALLDSFPHLALETHEGEDPVVGFLAEEGRRRVVCGASLRGRHHATARTRGAPGLSVLRGSEDHQDELGTKGKAWEGNCSHRQ